MPEREKQRPELAPGLIEFRYDSRGVPAVPGEMIGWIVVTSNTNTVRHPLYCRTFIEVFHGKPVDIEQVKQDLTSQINMCIEQILANMR